MTISDDDAKHAARVLQRIPVTNPELLALQARRRAVKLEQRLQREADKRVDAAYRVSCTGIEIDIMDIQKVFAVGRNAVIDGLDDAELANVIRTFVDTIRSN